MIEFSRSISIGAKAGYVWQALTEPERVKNYHLAPLALIEGKEGGRIVYGTVEKPLIEGRITVWAPENQLSHTFRFTFVTGTDADAETLVSYNLQPEGNGTTLILRHSGFDCENQSYRNIQGGWPPILDGIKWIVESEG